MGSILRLFTGKACPYIMAGLFAGLMCAMVALFATRATLSDVKNERDLAELTSKMTKASIDRLTADQTAANKKAIDNAIAYQEARRDAVKAQEALRKLDSANDTLVARLRASAQHPAEKCAVSDTVAKVWK